MRIIAKKGDETLMKYRHRPFHARLSVRLYLMCGRARKVDGIRSMDDVFNDDGSVLFLSLLANHTDHA